MRKCDGLLYLPAVSLFPQEIEISEKEPDGDMEFFILPKFVRVKVRFYRLMCLDYKSRFLISFFTFKHFM